ncbi:MAG: CBS domain-containing protein [Acidobacteria bacterium]|nr:CBS domain-containing protein [Acidobacteriota bacterium]
MAVHQKSLSACHRTTCLSDAFAKMTEMGVTQLPVIEDHRSVGSLKESRVLTKLLGDRDLLNSKVGDVMDASFPVVDVDTSLNKIKAKLQNIRLC